MALIEIIANDRLGQKGTPPPLPLELAPLLTPFRPQFASSASAYSQSLSSASATDPQLRQLQRHRGRPQETHRCSNGDETVSLPRIKCTSQYSLIRYREKIILKKWSAGIIPLRFCSDIDPPFVGTPFTRTTLHLATTRSVPLLAPSSIALTLSRTRSTTACHSRCSKARIYRSGMIICHNIESNLRPTPPARIPIDSLECCDDLETRKM